MTNTKREYSPNEKDFVEVSTTQQNSVEVGYDKKEDIWYIKGIKVYHDDPDQAQALLRQYVTKAQQVIKEKNE